MSPEELEKARALAYQASEHKVWTPPGVTGHGSDLNKYREWQAVVEICDKRYPEALDQITDLMQNCNSLRTRARKAEAEIERLRAIIDNPVEEIAWKMDLDILKSSNDDAELYLARKWHAAYRKAQNSNLVRKQEIERLRADNACLSKAVISIQEERDLAQAEFRAYHRAWEEQVARIQELEDALGEERAKVIMLIEKLQLVANDPDWQSKGLKHDFDWYLAESKKEIESGEPEDQRCRRLGEPNGWTDPEGKIGPDADVKPRSWQITDERVEALKVATGEMDLSENIFYLNSLKVMLEEAGQ